MTRPVDVTEKTGQWWEAYRSVSAELTSQKMRDTLTAMDMVEGVAQLASYMSLARNVMANDRTAAIVAAMLVSTGIKPTLVEYDEVD